MKSQRINMFSCFSTWDRVWCRQDSECHPTRASRLQCQIMHERVHIVQAWPPWVAASQNQNGLLCLFHSSGHLLLGLMALKSQPKLPPASLVN